MSVVQIHTSVDVLSLPFVQALVEEVGEDVARTCEWVLEAAPGAMRAEAMEYMAGLHEEILRYQPEIQRAIRQLGRERLGIYLEEKA